MENREDIMRPCGLVSFSKKTGKIAKSMVTDAGYGLLKLWALQNTTKTRDTIVFFRDTGDVICYYEGTDDFPNIIKDYLGNIEEYCPGLLNVIVEA